MTTVQDVAAVAGWRKPPKVRHTRQVDEQAVPTTTAPNARRPPRWEERENALGVLGDTLQWLHLTPAGWRQLDELVKTMSTALDDADWKTATAAVIELELMSPCRCTCPRRHPADGVPTPPATATAVGELAKKIKSNP